MTSRLPTALLDALAPAMEPAVDLPLLFHLAQEKIPPALGFQAGQLWLRDVDGRRLLSPRDVGLDPGDGFSPDLPREGMSLDLPVWVPERGAHSPLAALFQTDVRSWLLAPLREEGEAFGLLALLSTVPAEVPDDPSGVPRELAERLAKAARRALAQAVVARDLQLHQLLLDLVRRLSGDFPLEEMLHQLFRSLERMMPADAMFVAVKRPDGRYEALIETDLDERNRRLFFPSPRTMELDRAKMLEEVDPHDYLLIQRTPEELRRLKIETPGPGAVGNIRRRSASLLYVPVWVGDVLGGVLSVQSYQHDAYRHSDARRLLQIADYIGLALRLSKSNQ